MTIADRKKVTKFFVRQAFQVNRDTAGVDVVEIFDAVSTLDDWFTVAPAATEATNQAQIIRALPAPFSKGSTAGQKALLLSAVTLGRAGALP